MSEVQGGPSDPERLALKRRILALEKERDAALADNAALLTQLADVAGVIHTTNLDMGGNHRFSIRNGPAAVKAIGAMLALSPVNHPGAALLEEHRKAVVRAKRETLCDVLERLGADGAAEFRSDATEDALGRGIFDHVCWLELRARNEGLEKVAKDFMLRCDVAAEYGHRHTAEVWRNAASAARAMKESE